MPSNIVVSGTAPCLAYALKCCFAAPVQTGQGPCRPPTARCQCRAAAVATADSSLTFSAPCCQIQHEYSRVSKYECLCFRAHRTPSAAGLLCNTFAGFQSIGSPHPAETRQDRLRRRTPSLYGSGALAEEGTSTLRLYSCMLYLPNGLARCLERAGAQGTAAAGFAPSRCDIPLCKGARRCCIAHILPSHRATGLAAERVCCATANMLRQCRDGMRAEVRSQPAARVASDAMLTLFRAGSGDENGTGALSGVRNAHIPMQHAHWSLCDRGPDKL